MNVEGHRRRMHGRCGLATFRTRNGAATTSTALCSVARGGGGGGGERMWMAPDFAGQRVACFVWAPPREPLPGATKLCQSWSTSGSVGDNFFTASSTLNNFDSSRYLVRHLFLPFVFLGHIFWPSVRSAVPRCLGIKAPTSWKLQRQPLNKLQSNQPSVCCRCCALSPHLSRDSAPETHP